jgi:glucuronate isomerase
MEVIPEKFLLESDLADELYQRVKDLPIIDYHSHLPIDVLAHNQLFRNLSELWINGDHYKWRAMRLNGTPERFCSGDAPDREKFQAWSRTLPLTLRNPLFHWSHIELKQYFGINRELTPETADSIWNITHELLQTEEFRPQSCLQRSKVEILCTTDDPIDSLEHHRKVQSSLGPTVEVRPTFRPDKALQIDDATSFSPWVKGLKARSNREISNLETFLSALKDRHDAFHAMGCRVSDHGIEALTFEECTDRDATGIFENAMQGRKPSNLQIAQWQTFIMRHCAMWNHEKKWTMMLHLGAQRNNNSKLFHSRGADTGCDSVGDFSQGRGLNAFLNSLEKNNRLPRTILFNSNPRDNLLFATVTGNFFEEGIRGKVQFGPSWWFLDNYRGIVDHFESLSQVGLVANFVGMVTDSRSFLSFSRHDYFRRVICNIFANDLNQGLLPRDLERITQTLRGIFYENAKTFFEWR